MAKKFEYKALRVSMRGLPMEELDELGRRGFSVVASSIHNNDFLLLLQKETEVKAKAAPKKPAE